MQSKHGEMNILNYTISPLRNQLTRSHSHTPSIVAMSALPPAPSSSLGRTLPRCQPPEFAAGAEPPLRIAHRNPGGLPLRAHPPTACRGSHTRAVEPPALPTGMNSPPSQRMQLLYSKSDVFFVCTVYCGNVPCENRCFSSPKLGLMLALA